MAPFGPGMSPGGGARAAGAAIFGGLAILAGAFAGAPGPAQAAAPAGAPAGVPAAAKPGPSITTYDVGVRPRALAIADFDRDGRLDVAVACSGAGTVTLLFGTAGGRLRRAEAPAVAAGHEPSDVDAIDLDRDGDADLVIANHETSKVSVLLNDGHARFAPAPGSPFETGARPHVHGLATGDFDGDGFPDVAVDSADTREIRVLPGGPAGLGGAIAVQVGTMPYFRIGAADLGGGRPVILVPGQSDSTVLAIEARGGRLVPAPWTIRLSGKPWMVAGDDVSGDGRRDIVVVQSDAVGIWLAAGSGFEEAPGSPFAVPGATEVATGDLDGDGVADVAIGPWDGEEVTVLAGRPLTARRVRACARPIGLLIADLDGDHRNELLAACATTDRLAVVSAPVGRATGHLHTPTTVRQGRAHDLLTTGPRTTF